MKENIPTPEAVKTPPPLTPKDSLSVEVEGSVRGPEHVWKCTICEWVGFDMDVNESLDAHKRFHSKQGSKCVGNLEMMDPPDPAIRIEELESQLATAQAQLRRKDEAIEELQKENVNLDALSTDAFKKMIKTHSENIRLRAALEKLSKLGNGELCGNSVGNQIALAALADGKEGGE